MSKKKKKEGLGKDKILVISLVAIIAIFAGIVFLVPKGDDAPKQTLVTYKNYIFEQKGELWYTELSIQDKFKGWDRQYNLYFHYNPTQVEDVPTLKNSLGEATTPKILTIGGNKIYITMDPEYPASVVLSGVEIAKILGKVYELDVKASVTRESNKTDAPVITCADFGDGVRVIELSLSNETAIRNEKGCIIVKGTDPKELLRASSRLAFELLKIM